MPPVFISQSFGSGRCSMRSNNERLSDNTTRLVEGLASSAVVDSPSFQGTIQQDPRTKKDRFNMSLEFRHKPDPDCGKDHKPAKDAGPRKEGGHAPAAGSP